MLMSVNLGMLVHNTHTHTRTSCETAGKSIVPSSENGVIMVGKVPKGNTDTVPSDFAAVVEASAAGAAAGAVDAMVAKQDCGVSVFRLWRTL